MSKIETARALSASAAGPQLQVVQAIQQLQQSMTELQCLPERLAEQTASSTRTALQPLELVRQQIDQMQQELSSLPPYLANELSQRIEPLTSLPAQVQQALTSFDQVTAAQRQTLDELTQHQRQQLSQRLTEIDKAISQLQAQVQPIARLPAALSQQTRLLREAREELVEELETSSQRLSSQALTVRPSWWKRAAAGVAAGAVGGLLVMTGQAGFDRLVPPSATQNEAQMMRELWSRSTEQERELIRDIVNRQGR